jgi:hypothetical protein
MNGAVAAAAMPVSRRSGPSGAGSSAAASSVRPGSAAGSPVRWPEASVAATYAPAEVPTK